MTSPSCVLAVSACTADSFTVMVSELSPNSSTASTRRAPLTSTVMLCAPIRLETGGGDINIVMAYGQAREGIYSRVVGRDRLPDAGVHVGCGYRGFRNHRARAVLDGSRNAAPDGRINQHGKPRQQTQSQHEEMDLEVNVESTCALSACHSQHYIGSATRGVTML